MAMQSAKRINISNSNRDAVLSFERRTDGNFIVGFEDNYGVDVGIIINADEVKRLAVWLDVV